MQSLHAAQGAGHAAASEAKRASDAVRERRAPRRAPVGAVGQDVHCFNQTPRFRNLLGQHAVGVLLLGHHVLLELLRLIFDTVLLLDAVFLAVFLVDVVCIAAAAAATAAAAAASPTTATT